MGITATHPTCRGAAGVPPRSPEHPLPPCAGPERNRACVLGVAAAAQRDREVVARRGGCCRMQVLGPLGARALQETHRSADGHLRALVRSVQHTRKEPPVSEPDDHRPAERSAHDHD